MVQKATRVALKSTEFRSSEKYGLSLACCQSMTKRIKSTNIDCASLEILVYPIKKIIKTFLYKNMNSLFKIFIFNIYYVENNYQ